MNWPILLKMIGKELPRRRHRAVGIVIPFLQNIDFTDDGRHAVHIAPGERNHPVSMYTDIYAEEKSFPVLFAGQTFLTIISELRLLNIAQFVKQNFANMTEDLQYLSQIFFFQTEENSNVCKSVSLS